MLLLVLPINCNLDNFIWTVHPEFKLTAIEYVWINWNINLYGEHKYLDFFSMIKISVDGFLILFLFPPIYMIIKGIESIDKLI